MQPKDVVVPAGRRLALMVISSDRDFTIRPAAGTQLTLDLAGSSLALPVVGGARGVRERRGVRDRLTFVHAAPANTAGAAGPSASPARP